MEKLISLLKEKEKIFSYFLIFSILVFSFYFRSAAFGSKYVNADDPYLVYRIADYFKDNLKLPENDELRLYPYGWSYWGRKDHLVWYYTAGIFAFLFKNFSEDPALLASHFFPPFFGALMVFLIYLISKEIFKNWKIAILTALFLATIPANIYRSNSSFADKEPIAGFFMCLAIFFFLKSISKFNFLFSAISGISFSLMAMTWGGITIIMTVLGLFLMVVLSLNIFDRNLLKTFLITSLLTFSIVHFAGIGYIDLVAKIVNSIPIALIFMKFIDEKIHFSKKVQFVNYEKYFGTFSLVFLFFAGLIFSLIYWPLGERILFYLGLLPSPLYGEVVAQTVAENRPADWNEVYFQLGIFPIFFRGFATLSAFTFSIFGVLFVFIDHLLKRKEILVSLFLLTWFFVTLILGKGAVRLLFMATFPTAILAGFGLWNVFSKICEIKIKYFKLFGFLILFLTIFVNLASGYFFGKAMQPSMTKNWEDALIWIKENSNEDDLILSWWDYGYIIQKISQRKTYVDPGHPAIANDETIFDAKHRDQQVALLFTSTDEKKYLDWLRKINVKYIVHDITMIGKYSAVSKIASDGKHVDSILIFGMEESRCLKIENGICKKALFKFGPIYVVQENGRIYATLLQANEARNVSKICLGNEIILVDPNGLPGCVFVAQNAVAFIGIRCEETCYAHDLTDSLFVSMWFRDGNDLKHFKLVYSNPEVKIFEVIY